MDLAAILVLNSARLMIGILNCNKNQRRLRSAGSQRGKALALDRHWH